MYPPAIQPTGPRTPWASATRRPQTRQIAAVSPASSTVTSAPSSSAGISRAMKWRSNGTSIFVVVVEALRRRVLLQPLAVPLDIFLIADAGAQLADPGVEEQPPFEVARLHVDRVLRDIGEWRAAGVEPDQILVLGLIEIGDRLVDREGLGAARLDRKEQCRGRVEQQQLGVGHHLLGPRDRRRHVEDGVGEFRVVELLDRLDAGVLARDHAAAGVELRAGEGTPHGPV